MSECVCAPMFRNNFRVCTYDATKEQRIIRSSRGVREGEKVCV